MERQQIRNAVVRRLWFYLGCVRAYQLFCMLICSFFLIAFVFFRQNANGSIVEQVGFLIIFCGICAFTAWMLSEQAGIDIRITKRQLDDIENGICLAEWGDENSESCTFIGVCGLVFEKKYTPWQGVWDFSLQGVHFDAHSSKLHFNFARKSKANVNRPKAILVSVPRHKIAEVVDIVKKLNDAIENSDPINVYLRELISPIEST